MVEPLVAFKITDANKHKRELRRFRFTKLRGDYYASTLFMKGVESPLLKFNNSNYYKFFLAFSEFMKNNVEGVVILAKERPLIDLVINSLWVAGVEPGKIGLVVSDKAINEYLEYLSKHDFKFSDKQVENYSMVFYLNNLSMNPVINKVGAVFVGLSLKDNVFSESPTGFLVPVTYYKLRQSKSRGGYSRYCIMSDGYTLNNKFFNLSKLDKVIDSAEFIVTSIGSLLDNWLNYVKKRYAKKPLVYFTPNILLWGVKREDTPVGFAWVIGTNVLVTKGVSVSSLNELVEMAKDLQFYTYIDTKQSKWFSLFF